MWRRRGAGGLELQVAVGGSRVVSARRLLSPRVALADADEGGLAHACHPVEGAQHAVHGRKSVLAADADEGGGRDLADAHEGRGTFAEVLVLHTLVLVV